MRIKDEKVEMFRALETKTTFNEGQAKVLEKVLFGPVIDSE